jgi:hypothetical protein
MSSHGRMRSETIQRKAAFDDVCSRHERPIGSGCAMMQTRNQACSSVVMSKPVTWSGHSVSNPDVNNLNPA